VTALYQKIRFDIPEQKRAYADFVIKLDVMIVST